MADTTEKHANFVPEEKASAGIELNTVRPKTRSLNTTKVMLVGGSIVMVMIFALMSATSAARAEEGERRRQG